MLMYDVEAGAIGVFGDPNLSDTREVFKITNELIRYHLTIHRLVLSVHREAKTSSLWIFEHKSNSSSGLPLSFANNLVGKFIGRTLLTIFHVHLHSSDRLCKNTTDCRVPTLLLKS